MAAVRMGTTRPVEGVAALLGEYDGFILDQWGVLHDGVRPYPGAVDCLWRLRAAGKRIVVLSNSGKREYENIRLMDRMGFHASLYERFIGAGEDARNAIAERRSEFHRHLGTRCYAFTRAGDHSLLDGIGLRFVARVEEAEFLAAIGIDSPQRTVVDYEAHLLAGVERGLPLICANPDRVRVSPQGTVEAPGVLAHRYEQLGGRVVRHGKPYPEIYRSCFSAMSARPERIIAVGDSIEHDVLGADAVGIASAFVASGIHAGELVERWGQMPASETWDRFAALALAQPDYLLPAFVW